MAFAITDLDDLVTRVSRRAGGSSDSEFTDAIKEAIGVTEAELNINLRVPEMMVRSREEVDERWESLPTTFLKMRQVWWVDGDDPETGIDTPLKWASPERIGHYSRFRGNPISYTVLGGQYRIEPRSDQETYTVRLLYYAKVPDLSEDDPNTIILNRYPHLYFYGTLSNLEGWLVGDPRIASWRTMFERGILLANRAAGTRSAGAQAE